MPLPDAEYDDYDWDELPQKVSSDLVFGIGSWSVGGVLKLV